MFAALGFQIDGERLIEKIGFNLNERENNTEVPKTGYLRYMDRRGGGDSPLIILDDNETDDEDLPDSSRTNNDTSFDIVIGHIEDVLVDETFLELQNAFLEKYWQEFDNTEENKHTYMAIFQEYNASVEKFIETYLVEQIPGFSMDDLSKQLVERKDELDGEVFEVLFTFTDFLAFKEMFLDYRAMKEGNIVDLSGTLSVTPGILQPLNGFQT